MFEFHDFTDTSSNPKICAKTRSNTVCKYIFNHKKCTPILIHVKHDKDRNVTSSSRL